MRNLKKIIALVAVFAMLVSSVAFAGTFGDVAETDNYAKAIELLYDLQIVTGDDNDGDGVMDFRPEDTITRAEVTALIARIQGLDVVAQAATEFNDVPSSHWASGYVAQAATQGIVNGYGDGNFGPEDNVTYEQIVKMLMCTLGYEPFAADAGGFPTGYIAAATRYGVLDGVVGGGVGVEASRGMVAQMIYNAINTPLMDAVTYGADKEFGIYDGVNYKLMTLLTRDLKMIKFTGKVRKNSLSETIDTTARKMVTVEPYLTQDNSYYLTDYTRYDSYGRVLSIGNVTLYQGEVDCDPFLGTAVEVYAKKMSNFENNYTVVAMSKEPANSEVVFNLDQYVNFDSTTGIVKYLKDVNSNVELTKTVQSNATIIYNGIPVALSTEANADSYGELATFLSVNGAAATIQANNNLSGKVTLLDTDNEPAYDIVNIEVAVTGVVKEVTNKGQVKFMGNTNLTGYKAGGATGTIKLKFDENDVNTIINLTKDGEAIDYTELKKWDVVTVLWNGIDNAFDVTVLGEGNYVDGAVSVAKNNGDVVLTDGNTYELASNVYGITAVEPGLSGRFYIDAYGKIVALDDSVEIEGINTKVDQYAYVLDAEVTEGNWDGEQVVQVKLLDMSGEIYEAQLASKVKLVNFDNSAFSSLIGTAGRVDKTDITSAVKPAIVGEVEDVTFIPNLSNFADALINRVVAYEGNASGQVKTIAVEAVQNSEEDFAKVGSGSGAYNADAALFKGTGISVNADTVVFYITNAAKNLLYGVKDNVASAEMSSVGTIAGLIDGATYTAYGYAPDSNDEAQVVVLMNENGQTNPALNIAVIDSIGTSVVNGSDEVKTVSYWMNGELLTATTKVDMDLAAYNAVASANQGDVLQLTVENNVITFAKSVLNFTQAGTNPYAMDVDTTPVFTKNSAGTDEGYIFGAITDFSNNGTALVQPLNADGSTNGGIEYVKEGEANVYVYDINMKKDYRIEVGSLGDAVVDEDLIDATDIWGGKTGKVDNAGVAGPAYGMMDYVFVRTYNNKPADIVVYRNFDWGDYTAE